MRNKIVDAAEAVAIIRSGDTVASSGFVGVGTPDEIIKALEQRFVQTGEPRDLSLVFAAAPGDGADRGQDAVGVDDLPVLDEPVVADAEHVRGDVWIGLPVGATPA